VLAAVVGQGDGRFFREPGSIELEPGDPPADALRVQDVDAVEAAAVAVADLEALPGGCEYTFAARAYGCPL
jgi:hypothetical protein